MNWEEILLAKGLTSSQISFADFPSLAKRPIFKANNPVPEERFKESTK